MTDIVEKVGNSIIQHGKENNRVYIMKIDKNNTEELIKKVDKITELNEYTKVFAKVPSSVKNLFIKNGFKIEAKAEKFYLGKEDCYFMGKYFSDDRSRDKFSHTTREVLSFCKSKKRYEKLPSLNKKYKIRKARLEDIEDMAKLYKLTFKSYPFPIFNKEYIEKTMNDNVVYFGTWYDEKLISLSSIELYKNDSNAEMTDFATHPEYRGENLSLHLLNRMEKELRELDIKTAYSISRSVSYGMNSTFVRMGYEYGGTLINNTNIDGQIENMNVWYKFL
ncbi:beta-lysine N6-acetyltransferase [Gottschalkia purinilytica]|uniref:Beta-lysine N6-acetyltransferase n=1 Tax=Gottschalkia purinilytica TaxID=1503 RepID=A0A0L0WAR1_GOTPU|nr:putative beta-lysine N-acetyltransferase [Gottschalkia purinilytica]KNF08604.1 beta-lysine N6-acetyltransferase [Gottschalkia purinilytica]